MKKFDKYTADYIYDKISELDVWYFEQNKKSCWEIRQCLRICTDILNHPEKLK